MSRSDRDDGDGDGDGDGDDDDGDSNMTSKSSASPRKPRRTVELKVAPEPEKWLKERSASPEGQKPLDEPALVYVEAAVA